MNQYRAFHTTSIGASHIKVGKVCQDSSESVESNRYRLAVISDGHGGSDYFRSDRGSKFAVQAFCECVADLFPQASLPTNAEASSAETDVFLQNKARDFADAVRACKTQKQIDETMQWFMRSVVTRWNLLVEDDIVENPFAADEMSEVSDTAKARYLAGQKLQSAYGATLIGAVVTEDFWFGVQIGDGKCVAFSSDGESSEPIPWDDECMFHFTTSICDTNAFREFRFVFQREAPAAIFMGSDGIDDSIAGTKMLHRFYRTVLSEFAEKPEEQAAQELADYLPDLSARGSGDDMSIACIINLERVRQAAVCFQKQPELYLRVYRVGNLGATDVDADYLQKREVEANEGILYLCQIGCNGFGQGVQELEVTTVTRDSVHFVMDGKQYLLAPSETIVHQTGKQGDAQFDTITIHCVCK